MGAGFDPNKNVVLHDMGEFEVAGAKFASSIVSYNKGLPKLEILRLDGRGFPHKLGRLSRLEAREIGTTILAFAEDDSLWPNGGV